MFVVIVIVLFIVAIVAVSYNGLVASRNSVKNAWSQIEVQLQRRFDLIPNLVESVKAYMNHEDSLLGKITELRTAWGNASTINEKATLDNKLSSEIKSVMAVAENYPELKASQNFIQLQQELTNTESKISSAREFYNETVTNYNNKIESIPMNIIANIFKFTKEDLFTVDNNEVRNNVKVDFNK